MLQCALSDGFLTIGDTALSQTDAQCGKFHHPIVEVRGEAVFFFLVQFPAQELDLILLHAKEAVCIHIEEAVSSDQVKDPGCVHIGLTEHLALDLRIHQFLIRKLLSVNDRQRQKLLHLRCLLKERGILSDVCDHLRDTVHLQVCDVQVLKSIPFCPKLLFPVLRRLPSFFIFCVIDLLRRRQILYQSFSLLILTQFRLQLFLRKVVVQLQITPGKLGSTASLRLHEHLVIEPQHHLRGSIGILLFHKCDQMMRVRERQQPKLIPVCFFPVHFIRIPFDILHLLFLQQVLFVHPVPFLIPGKSQLLCNLDPDKNLLLTLLRQLRQDNLRILFLLLLLIILKCLVRIGKCCRAKRQSVIILRIYHHPDGTLIRAMEEDGCLFRASLHDLLQCLMLLFRGPCVQASHKGTDFIITLPPEMRHQIFRRLTLYLGRRFLKDILQMIDHPVLFLLRVRRILYQIFQKTHCRIHLFLRIFLPDLLRGGLDAGRKRPHCSKVGKVLFTLSLGDQKGKIGLLLSRCFLPLLLCQFLQCQRSVSLCFRCKSEGMERKLLCRPVIVLCGVLHFLQETVACPESRFVFLFQVAAVFCFQISIQQQIVPENSVGFFHLRKKRIVFGLVL